VPSLFKDLFSHLEQSERDPLHQSQSQERGASNQRLRIMPVTTALQPHPRSAAPTPTATTATPAGQQQHRGFLSFRTTFNIFKYTSRANSPRRELIGPPPSAAAAVAVATQPSVYNYSVPLTGEEEYDRESRENKHQLALLPASPTRTGADSFFDAQSYHSSRYHSTSTFEGFGRPRRDTLRSPTPNGITSEFEDMNAGALILAPGPSELERPKSNTDKQSSSSAGGNKTAAKLRMALSLLRRKSNQNLRKAYVEPVDETAEGRNTFDNAVGSTLGVVVVASLFVFWDFGMLTVVRSLASGLVPRPRLA